MDKTISSMFQYKTRDILLSELIRIQLYMLLGMADSRNTPIPVGELEGMITVQGEQGKVE